MLICLASLYKGDHHHHHHAKDAWFLFVVGFKGVESRFPLDIPIEELSHAREEAQIEHVQMNAFDGMLG